MDIVLKTSIEINNMEKIQLIFYILFVLIISSCRNREQIVDQRLLSNNDFRLFQGTPAWELAKTVEDEEEKGIYEILKKEPILVNYQSPKYGVTLLHLAVSHQLLKSIECLLKAGANVNIRDKEYGETPLNTACLASAMGGKSIEIINVLIKNGANVNVTDITNSDKMPRSPLMSACLDNFKDAVVLLIAKGADVNYIRNSESTALGESLMLGHYRIAYYLLLHGADYAKPIMHIRDDRKEECGKITRSVFIKEEMEKKKIDYFTPEREYYYKIVDFLKEKGIFIKETGKRSFDPSTFIKEIKELRE